MMLMLALVCFVAAIVFAVMFFTKKTECPVQECPVQKCPVVKCSLKDDTKLKDDVDKARDKMNSFFDEVETFAEVAEEVAASEKSIKEDIEKTSKLITDEVAEKRIKEVVDKSLKDVTNSVPAPDPIVLNSKDTDAIFTKMAAIRQGKNVDGILNEQEVKENNSVRASAVQPNESKIKYAPYTKEEDNKDFQKLLKEFLSLVNKEDFQTKWDKRYENYLKEPLIIPNDDLKDILQGKKSNFVHDDDKTFLDELITNLDDPKTKVLAIITKDLLREKPFNGEGDANLGNLKDELNTLKVEMEKYGGVTGLSLEHLQEIAKFNGGETVNKILMFSVLNGNLEHFCKIACEFALLERTLRKYMRDVSKKFKEKIDKNPELKKAVDNDKKTGDHKRKELILASNIIFKLNIANVDDLKNLNNHVYETIMKTDINIMDFINRKLIYGIYLSGFARSLVESGVYMILKDGARKEVVEYSNAFNEIFSNEATAGSSVFSLYVNVPEFIHLFLNDIFMNKTMDFILSIRPTEFLNIRENIRKGYNNYKNTIKEFEKISEIINLKNIKL